MLIRRIDIRNMAFLLAAQIVAVVAGVFAFTWIGRHLAIAEMGRYSFAVSATLLLGLLADFGLRYVGIREIALHPERAGQIYGTGLLLWVLLSLTALGGLALLLATGLWRAEAGVLMLASLVAVSQFIADPSTWIFFGKERVDLGAVILIADRLFYVLGINLAGWFFPSAEGLLWGALAANLVRAGLAACWARSWLQAGQAIWPDWTLARRLVRQGASLGIAVLVMVVYSEATIVLLQGMVPALDLGYYAVAFGMVSIVLVGPTSLTMALFPTLARVLKQDSSDGQRLNLEVIRLNLALVMPLTVLVLAFAGSLLSVWVGPGYRPAGPILQVMALAMAAGSLNFAYRIFFFAADHPGWETVIDLAGLAAVLTAGTVLSQAYGSLGMAAAFLLVETGVALAKVLVGWRLLHMALPVSLLARSILAAALPAVCLAPLWGVPAFIRILVYLLAVGGLTVVLQILPATMLRLGWDYIRQSTAKLLQPPGS